MCDCGFKPRTIYISLTSKEQHPLRHRIRGSFAYAVDLVPGGVIFLRRFRTYIFSFNPGFDGNYSLYFTIDPAGGGLGRLKCFPPPVKQGTIALYTSDDIPNLFYYQDFNHEFLGGPIVILER
jgi:hypothetical protein